MKKASVLFAAVMMAVLIAFVAGCSSGSASSSSASASASSASSSAASTASASASESASAASSDASATVDASGSSATQQLSKGEYTATFKTDSSMFHVNEADEGKGVLTVADDGSMTIYVRLAAKGIVNVYVGTKAEAEADSANVIQPKTDTVTYKDGATKEVYGFEIPVPALDQEFNVAILGEKGAWYDHKVSVSDPVAK